MEKTGRSSKEPRTEPEETATPAARGEPRRRVLNVGSGPVTLKRLPAVFGSPEWEEVRLDVDPAAEPDILGSFVDMTGVVEDAGFDAVWSSHSLEHLRAHEVPKALAQFRRVLKPDGFALITCPDLQAVAEVIAAGRTDEMIYMSPVGPISALDMIYGHGRSIELGQHHMAHNTGFTEARLGLLIIEAGFREAWTAKGPSLTLWALGLMPDADRDATAARFRNGSPFLQAP